MSGKKILAVLLALHCAPFSPWRGCYLRWGPYKCKIILSSCAAVQRLAHLMLNIIEPVPMSRQPPKLPEGGSDSLGKEYKSWYNMFCLG